LTTEKRVSDQTCGPGAVVAFHYDLYDGEASRIESSREAGEPVRFLFGEQGVLAALQDAFRDKAAGSDFAVTIPAEQAYGRRYPERVRRVPLKQLGIKGKPVKAGQLVRLPGERGSRPATVLKAGKFNVDVDTNHPLAGRDLTFDVQIVEVRPATDSEQAHGHVHGPGGHQHA